MSQFASMNLLDPTITREEEPIEFAPRPVGLQGLRIGLIENTKKNAETVLNRLAQKLGQAHGNEEAIRQWREDALGIVLSSKGIKGLRKRERPWKPPASDRSVKRAAAAQAQQDQAAAEAQALEDRRAAFRAIAWPESVTALQSEAYRLHVVEGHSLAETGRLMAEITGKPGGIGRASVQTHVKKAKKSAGMQ